MNKLIYSKFKEANQNLENGDVVAFAKSLIELYLNLTCNCFFTDQQEIDYNRQSDLVNKYSENENNFFIYIAKGFVALRLNNESEAYNNLTKAIGLDCSSDLAYSLRALTNYTSIEDAKTAVLLNPSARNYFVLANSFDYESDNSSLTNSIIYFGKAIKLRSDFACAYNNRAIRLKRNRNFEGAVKDYLKCIEIDKSHWAYYDLWFCLNELNRYDEALKYVELGSQLHSDDISYQYALGVANEKVEKYKIAINHYQNYLEANPHKSSVKKMIEICNRKIKTISLKKAKENFHIGDYNRAIVLFENYINEVTNIREEDLDIYLVSLLKNENSDTLIDENSPIYKRLDNLKASYFEKVDRGTELLDEEENVNKLKVYHLFSIIGFGKHKGKFLQDIISKDAEYILWAIINLDHFSISKSFFQSSKLKNQPLFLLALEHNLIKDKVIEKWSPEDTDDHYYNDKINDDYLDNINGDWGGLDDEEASVGYWNTQ